MFSTSVSENPAPTTTAFGAVEVSEEALDPRPEAGLMAAVVAGDESSERSSKVAWLVVLKTVTTGECQLSAPRRDSGHMADTLEICVRAHHVDERACEHRVLST